MLMFLLAPTGALYISMHATTDPPTVCFFTHPNATKITVERYYSININEYSSPDSRNSCNSAQVTQLLQITQLTKVTNSEELKQHRKTHAAQCNSRIRMKFNATYFISVGAYLCPQMSLFQQNALYFVFGRGQWSMVVLISDSTTSYYQINYNPMLAKPHVAKCSI